MCFIILLLHLFSKSLMFHYFNFSFAWLLKDVISCASGEIGHMVFSAQVIHSR